jgi:hypothetical protein
MEDKVVDIVGEVIKELNRADKKYRHMPESVEGLKTLQCEVCELDREVFRVNQDSDQKLTEAIQVAAMAVKFIRDCCEDIMLCEFCGGRVVGGRCTNCGSCSGT